MATPKGKQVAVDYSPSNYSASGTAEDHLSGIDTALGGKSDTSHTHTESDITDLDHTDANAIHDNAANEIHSITQKVTPANDDEILIEDSEASYVKKRVLLSAISGGGTHASTHITGGGDEIDGDKLDIDWNPSNYTPTTDPSEVDSVDNLTAHLAGIDDALVVEVGGGLETITYVDSTQADAGSGATLTLTKPTGVQDGDLLLAVIVVEDDATQTWDTVPSGWTLLVDSYATGGAPVSPPSCSVWYRVASSEGSSYDWILNASGLGIIGAMLAYRNVDNSTPMDATRTLAQGDNSQNPNPPSIDTVTNGAFVVAIAFHDDDTGLDSMSSGYAEREEVADANGGNGATLGVCDDEIVSAGTEDPGTFQNSGSDSEEWGAITIALRPATAAPTIYTLASHAARHVQGGGDEVDGDELDIDFTPSYYSPTTGTPGSDVDHLAAHLRGIDNLLGTTAALTSTAPVNVTKAAAAVGVGTTAARHDHKHDVTTAAPSTIGTANSEGSATSLARSDHVHNIGTHASRHQDGGADEISVAGLSGELADAQKGQVRINSGGSTYTRRRINLIAGTNVTLGIADDATDQEVDVTINATGGSSAAGGETVPYASCDSTSLNLEANDLAFATAFYAKQDMTVATVSCCCVQTGSGNVYAAIYDSGLNKLRDETTGASCSSTGIKTLTLSSSLSLTKGNLYYVVFRCTANGSLFLGHTNTSSSGTGSLPPSFIDNNSAASSFPSTLSVENRPGQAAWAHLN